MLETHHTGDRQLRVSESHVPCCTPLSTSCNQEQTLWQNWGISTPKPNGTQHPGHSEEMLKSSNKPYQSTPSQRTKATLHFSRALNAYTIPLSLGIAFRAQNTCHLLQEAFFYCSLQRSDLSLLRRSFALTISTTSLRLDTI